MQCEMTRVQYRMLLKAGMPECQKLNAGKLKHGITKIKHQTNKRLVHTYDAIISISTVARHRGKTYCARAVSLFPRKLCASALCLKTLLFWRIKSQQQLPVVNFKKVKTYEGKLGPEKSVLGD